MHAFRLLARVAVTVSMVSATAAVAAPAVFATTLVTSAGNLPAGGISSGTATFQFIENSPAAYPPGGGTLTVTITDSANNSTVHFSGTPTLQAPGSLGATLTVAPNSFTVNAVASDTSNVEKVTVSGLAITADVGAAAGDIKATLTGTLAPGALGNAATATGSTLSTIGTGTGSIVVSVSSPCIFAVTGGANSALTFSDVSDPRTITAVSGLSGGQQTLTLAGGTSVHGLGVGVTQTVANCQGSQIGAPGTVGGVSPTNHLVFQAQPGGGPAGAAWAQQPVVSIQNAANQVVTTDNTTVVTLAISTNPAGGVLTCTNGLSRTVVNGVATFSGCSISIASAAPYALAASSSPAAATATSALFLISGPITTVRLTDAIAPGVNHGITGFDTVSIVVARNRYVTVLGMTSPNLSGQSVEIWIKRRSADWTRLTSRTVESDGTVHYFARVNGWRAYQLRFAGTASLSSAVSHGRIATSR